MVKCNDSQNKMCVKDVSMNSPRHMIYDLCIISLEYHQVGTSLSVKDFDIKYVTEIPAKLHKYLEIQKYTSSYLMHCPYLSWR